MHITIRLLAICLTVTLLTAPAFSATYYIDYEQGRDTNLGQSPDAPFKHAPGDRNATDIARSVKIQPGDVIKFKGGVTYRGLIAINVSGQPEKPITFDGNLDNSFGHGKAVIDGSTPVNNLKPCQSAEEAFGNPNYKNIYIGYLPAQSFFNTIGLAQGDEILPIAQHPNPASPIFQEDPQYFLQTGHQPPVTHTDFKVRYLSQLDETPNRPLVAMFDGSRNSAVINQMNAGTEIEVKLPAPVTVTSLALIPQPGYGNPRRVTFHADGQLILDTKFAPADKKLVEQKMALARQATFKTLVIKFHSTHPREEGNIPTWGAIQKIAAYDDAGNNRLLTRRTTTLTHEYFAQSDPDYWDGSYLSLYARDARVYYKKILGYDPATKTVTMETLTHSQIPYNPGSAFSMLNSPRIIDYPGEYSVNLTPEPDGTHKFYIWPLRLKDGQPENLTYATWESAFVVNRASHITLQGFIIKKQGGSRGSNGINARGPATDLTVTHTTVTGLRGNSSAIHSSRVDNVLVDQCRIVDNAGHTKGILLRNGQNIITRNCFLQRNSSTALDYYTVHNGAVQNCTVLDNTGMHANGLTFYVGCSDILVENNYVARGNVALTLQHGNNMIIRNNILSGNRAIGLWSGRAYDNIVITNNVLLIEGENNGSYGAIYGGNNASKNYTIANNIVDGLSGNVMLKAEIHHNIFTQLGPVQTLDNLGNNQYIPDKNSLFVDAAQVDFHVQPGHAGINQGIFLGGINKRYDDILTTPAPQSPVVGLYQPTAADSAIATIPPAPADFQFSFEGYRIQPPTYTPPTGYTSIFKQKRNTEPIFQRGIDYTGETGGQLLIKKAEGWIYRWDKKDHAVTWTFDIPNPGPYELVIRFASEVPSVRHYALNGQPVPGLEDIKLKATGGWSIWEKTALSKPLYLKKGSNTLTITNVSNSLNIRNIYLVPLENEQPIQPHYVTD